jgi:hypothetical protein
MTFQEIVPNGAKLRLIAAIGVLFTLLNDRARQKRDIERDKSIWAELRYGCTLITAGTFSRSPNKQV